MGFALFERITFTCLMYVHWIYESEITKHHYSTPDSLLGYSDEFDLAVGSLLSVQF